jgi:phosphate transport system protein
MFIKIQQSMRQHPDQIELFVHLLSISRHLERIADHATNIAEDVIYMINGQIIRHHPEKYQDQS